MVESKRSKTGPDRLMSKKEKVRSSVNLCRIVQDLTSGWFNLVKPHYECPLNIRLIKL